MNREEHMDSGTRTAMTVLGYVIGFLIVLLIVYIVARFVFGVNLLSMFEDMTNLTTSYKVIDLDLSPPDINY